MQAGDAAKLARVLALLGSDFAGERASAALAASRLMKRLGLTWADVLMPRPEGADPRRAAPPPPDVLSAVESRLRQCQRENEELRRGMAQLRRRLEARIQRPPAREEDEE